MTKDETILLAHGAGGELSRELLEDLIVPKLANPTLMRLEDSALIEVPSQRLAYTTDSYVVKPLFFPGGDIGKLAVCGTINDLAALGARPLVISLGFIIEEGLPIKTLSRVLDSIAAACEEAKVSVVTGDTKVVEKGAADRLFINTSGIGIVPEGVTLAADTCQPGDSVIVSGTLGDHGIAVLSQREGLSFETPLQSDVASLAGLVAEVLATGSQIHSMRDPTRGGVAAALHEIARASGVTICLFEETLPMREEVLGACEMLGLDPLYVANEGKMLFIVNAEATDIVLAALKTHLLGENASLIGEVTPKQEAFLIMKTTLGPTRIVTLPYGNQLPRIC